MTVGIPPLRLLMTTDAVGGVWQYSIALCSALARRGHEIVLAAMGPAPDEWKRQQAQAIPGLRLVETGLALDWLCDGPAPVARAAQVIASLAEAEDVDILHCNMPTLAGAASFPVPTVAVAHGCVSTWWEAAKAEPLAPAYHWHREMTREGLRAADDVVAPSAAYAATIQRHYALDAVPAAAHNGTPSQLRRKAPAVQDSVITVGRMWDPVKGASLMDRVAAKLHVPFIAVGATRGPHGESVRLDHLHALGEIDGNRLAKLLSSRPIYVSAASFEPFGLAVLEAAKAGCALVLSDIPVFRELWDGAALFVPREEAACREAIDRLIGDPALRLSLGEAAAQRAERYTPEALAAGMLAIYAPLLNRSDAGRRSAA